MSPTQSATLTLVATLAVGCATRLPTDGPRRLASLAEFIDDVHPAPYRYIGPEDLGVLQRQQAEALRDGQTSLPAAASLVTGQLGDAHLARLLAVEGTPIEELLAGLAAGATVDGGRADVRDAEAVRHFASHLLRAFGRRDRWTFEVQRPDAEPETLELPGISVEDAQGLGASRQSLPTWGANTPQHQPTLVEVDFDHEMETVLLRLPDFVSNDHDNYAAAVEALFAEMSGDERLIVDVRGNEGGFRTHGIAVLKQLLEGPFAQWTAMHTRIRRIPRRYADRVIFPIAPEEVLATFGGTRNGDRWTRTGDPLAGRMIPVDEPHRGPVVVFVDDATNSAAVELVVALLAHREGVKVLGRPTQGACDRHSGEMPVFFSLGEGIGVLVSLFDIELVAAPGCVPGEGIPIDVDVAFTQADWRDGRDPYLAALARWIAE